MASYNRTKRIAEEIKKDINKVVINLLEKALELLKIFEEEKSNYLKLTSNKELTDMKYFIDELHKNKGGAITEVIAETYALMHTLTNDSHTILRGEYLQQYFPKTMAYIAGFIQ